MYAHTSTHAAADWSNLAKYSSQYSKQEVRVVKIFSVLDSTGGIAGQKKKRNKSLHSQKKGNSNWQRLQGFL